MKLLFLRFSSIGDIVLCTPVIRACKVQLNAEIHFVTKTPYKEILTSSPYITKILTFDKNWREVKTQLQENQYDYIIDLHKNIRSKQIKQFLQVKSFSFPKLNIEKWLMVNTKYNRLPDIHIVDRYFKAVESLGVLNDGKGLDFFMADRDFVTIKSKDLKGQTMMPLVSIVLGATYGTKKIPVALCHQIISNLSAHIFLIGGPDETDTGELLSIDYDHVTNGCGKYSIAQSASILQQSDIVITGDTGMMHIAAALKKKIIMVWGSTVPEFGMGPYMTESYSFAVDNLSCRPCSKLGYDQCPKGHFKCMLNHNPAAIIDTIQTNL